MKLRPHHGMCIAYFQGHGYSEDFTAHLSDLIRRIREENVTVTLTVGRDDVCAHCPNLADGVCTSCGKVEDYDRRVLELCGLKEGKPMEAADFLETVRQRVLLLGKRSSICGKCQWSGLCEGMPEVFL